MGRVSYFISDVHLHLEDREKELYKEKLFEKFINLVCEDGTDLFILGDLFDYWFEYKKVIQKDSYRVLSLFYKLKEKNIKIHYLIGNHDFYHNNIFQDEFGATLYEDPIEVEIDGYKFFLAHGDGMIKNDTGYKILKFFLRNKYIQKLAYIIHPDFLLNLAIHSSRASRKYTTKKNYGEIDGLKEIAKQKIENENFKYVIMGHAHNLEKISIGDGTYINLGSWITKPVYCKFYQGNLELLEME